AAPWVGLMDSAGEGRRRKIFADVIKIAQKVSLLAEDFLALQTNPGSPIGQGVDPAVQAPAGQPGTMSPAPSGLLHTAKGGRIDRGDALFGLRGDQAHLLPFSVSFAFPGTGVHGADHRPIALGVTVLFPN